VIKLEQLNIVGKRSGEGFVAHKAMMVSTLSRALSARVVLMDLTIGLKGLLGYLKALGGSNVVKVIPSNGSASGSQANGHKRLKVICGANTSYLADNEWIGDKTPLTLCEVRVSPVNTVTPNVGASELAEALARVLPFTATEDTRPVLQCVLFKAGDGKLTLVSADGFRLAVIALDYDGEGQALINRDDLKGVVNALKKAKRARVSFEGEDVTKTATLIIDTELIRYKWASVDGSYPDYEKLIPTEFNIFAHFDTVEAVKAVNSLKALSEGKSYPIDLTIGDGMITMADPDDKGQAEIPADTMGQGFVRIDGKYFAEALRACGGMAELMLNNAYSPMLFTVDGYQLVVMPMLSDKANEQAKADREAAKAEAEPAKSQPEATEPKAEKTEPAKPKKAKHSKAKEPVAVT
jgi:DNA polymerase-3 subunit beta